MVSDLTGTRAVRSTGSSRRGFERASRGKRRAAANLATFKIGILVGKNCKVRAGFDAGAGGTSQRVCKVRRANVSSSAAVCAISVSRRARERRVSTTQRARQTASIDRAKAAGDFKAAVLRNFLGFSRICSSKTGAATMAHPFYAAAGAPIAILKDSATLVTLASNLRTRVQSAFRGKREYLVYVLVAARLLSPLLRVAIKRAVIRRAPP